MNKLVQRYMETETRLFHNTILNGANRAAELGELVEKAYCLDVNLLPQLRRKFPEYNFRLHGADKNGIPPTWGDLLELAQAATLVCGLDGPEFTSYLLVTLKAGMVEKWKKSYWETGRADYHGWSSEDRIKELKTLGFIAIKVGP